MEKNVLVTCDGKELELKNVPNHYRPIPFWSWNEKLNPTETREQIKKMHMAGIGGFFMHARGGLQTEYMGEEWFENVDASVDEAKVREMGAWAYDENGWPSGFGGGRVNGKGEKFQQKYLRVEEGDAAGPHTITHQDGYRFYYDVNPFYVDTLDEEVVADFIQEIYEPYYARYKNEIKGFFTDEPQISRNGIPWSLKLPEAYQKAYGEDLLPHLTELFYPVRDYKLTRIRFWKLITDLFSQNFMKQIYDWCTERGLDFTGHLVCEETCLSQLTCNGAVMPHYEYFTIPGMDWLCRPIRECLTPMQLSSAAQQLGKKQVLSETFALCGHNVSFEELKGLFEWQMVHGVNLLCQHLEGYSLRGIRKRDYPPAMFYQQPWWEEYRAFNDVVSRTGMLLANGEVECDTLVIHPQTTAWAMFDQGENKGIEEWNRGFLTLLRQLEEKHIVYHLGDETLMERHGRVEGKTLIVGTQRYTTVIVPDGAILLEKTRQLLEKYAAEGGRFAQVEEIPSSSVIDNPSVTYAKRKYQGATLHYFVNSNQESHLAYIGVGAKKVNLLTGEIEAFDGTHLFAPYDSLMVLEDGTARMDTEEKEDKNILSLDGEWEMVSHSPNVLTLDFCDYYFDNQLIEKNGYILNIQHRACEMKRPVPLRLEFAVRAESVPKDLCLVTETPEIFTIMINGREVEKKDEGYFIDGAFRKIPIAAYMKTGENQIVMECLFRQSEQVYENLEKSKIFESEKNKLTYDMEIEPVYLVGDFSVSTDGKVKELDHEAMRYAGDFVLREAKKCMTLSHIEQQGFPFFAGKMSLQKKFILENTDQKLVFRKRGINAIRVKVNGKDAGVVLWNPTELDLSAQLVPGENVIELTLYNNLRNMMGPHHAVSGELHAVGPAQFFKEPCIWSANPLPNWDSDYCFVETSLI